MKAPRMKLLQDPYVKRVLALADDPGLFQKHPAYLRSIRTGLLRDCLKYFLRHRPDYYQPLLRNLSVRPERAKLEDLVHLAVPSQTLRGDLWRKMAVPEASEHADEFMSSGTTGAAFLKIGRSPIDDRVTATAVARYVSHSLGYEMKDGLLLVLATPQVARRLILFRDPLIYYAARGVQVILAMAVKERFGEKRAGGLLEHATISRRSVRQFIEADVYPKYIFGAPFSIHQMIESLDGSAVELGTGGAVFSAGGSKGTNLLPFRELQKKGKATFLAGSRKRRAVSAPWFDGLGHTEGLMISLTAPGTNVRIPHPLEEVFLVNDSFKPVKYGKGFAGHWNPLNTTYLEAFYPSDYYRGVAADGYYGWGFIYDRRAPLDDSGAFRPGCSSAGEVAE